MPLYLYSAEAKPRQNIDNIQGGEPKIALVIVVYYTN